MKENLKQIKDMLSDWPALKAAIWQGITSFVGDADPRSGLATTGYSVGIVAFEVLLAFLTEGATVVRKISQISGQGFALLRQLGSKEAFRDLIGSGLHGSKAVVQQLRCKILLVGCFVKDTPVLMAHNPFKNVAPAMALAMMPFVAPIQDIVVDDMIKAYRHAEGHYTTASLNDVYVPGWQTYDYLDITPETWQVGKFIIREGSGHIIEVEVNRPNTWFEERELENPGDASFFYMPEVNITGEATLLSVRPTIIDSRTFEKNESGQVNRPVISTFKRYAPLIYDYHFDDGGMIGATPEHPFFSLDRQAYIAVGELAPGERVKTASGKRVHFLSSAARAAGEPVYNFEVWREHNYFVGDHGFLVHNA